MADDSIPEEWRPVEGWPYEVSNRGRVRRSNSRGSGVPRVLKPYANRNGHLQVRLCDGPRPYIQPYVHRLVICAFVGPQPTPRHEVAHWDGNPRNNSVGNLRWATSAENMADKIRHGRTNRGGNHGSAKVTANDVLEMRRMWTEQRCTQKDLAARYGLDASSVCRIVRRQQCWLWLDETAHPGDGPN